MTCTRIVLNRASKQIGLAVTAIFFLTGLGLGQPEVTLGTKVGPPTTSILVSGSGFSDYAAIDIYFDTSDVALALANASGSFAKISIEVPASALPGDHWVSAVQRSADTGAQTSFLVQTNWPEVGFTPAGKRYNPYENVLSLDTIGNMDVLWSFSTGFAVNSSPAVVNGFVYFVGGDGYLYLLSAKTGAVGWRTNIGSLSGTSSPTVVNGVVYVGSNNGTLYAINASTGAVLWTFADPGAQITSSPVVASGMVYFGVACATTCQYGNGVYALNASNGAYAWGYNTADGPVNPTPVLANGMVYAPGNSSGGEFVYALDATSGALRWESSGLGLNGQSSSLAVASGVVYLGAEEGDFVSLNATSGAVLWNYTPAGLLIGGVYSPAVANGLVYIGTGGLGDNSKAYGNVYALNTSGDLVWSYASATGFTFSSAPAVANGLVYIGCEDNNVYALNAADGVLEWSYVTGGPVNSSPAVVNGVVYVASNDANLYAFGLPDAPDSANSAHRPDLKTLRPDFSLKPSQPVTKVPSSIND